MEKSMQAPCPIEWLVIPAPDLETTAGFYTQVFNWKVTRYRDDFWLFDAGPVHGAFDLKLEVAEQGISFSISVNDIGNTLDLIDKLGGKEVKSKYMIAGGFGFTASFRDPVGNLVELWAEK